MGNVSIVTPVDSRESSCGGELGQGDVVVRDIGSGVCLLRELGLL